MHKFIVLTIMTLLTLGACVAGNDDIESSSDQYEPEGFDPERGLEPPETDPSEPPK